jgi:hypothetical protein
MSPVCLFPWQPVMPGTGGWTVLRNVTVRMVMGAVMRRRASVTVRPATPGHNAMTVCVSESSTKISDIRCLWVVSFQSSLSTSRLSQNTHLSLPTVLVLICVSECPAGYFGLGCLHHCQCDNKGTCDHVSGACTCLVGWTGTFCEKRKRTSQDLSKPYPEPKL